MKKCTKIIILMTFIATNIMPGSQPSKGRQKQPLKKYVGKTQPKPTTKFIIKKSDKELLEEQRRLLANEKLISRLVSNHRELKNFWYNDLCPIRNWTQQDQINTARWVRKSYSILMKGPDRVDKGGPRGDDVLVRFLSSMFQKSPYYLNLTKQQQEDGEPGPYFDIFLKSNETKDMKNVKPAIYEFTEFRT